MLLFYAIAGSFTMNVMCLGERYLRRPYGTPEVLLVAGDPTLKRGANKHCAYGAVALVPDFKIETCGTQAHARRGTKVQI